MANVIATLAAQQAHQRGVYDLYVAECNEIHALMDAGEVPREFNGAKFSIAQRVRWFYHTREAANAAIAGMRSKPAH